MTDRRDTAIVRLSLATNEVESDVVKATSLPRARVKAALRRLQVSGAVRVSEGHHHMDGVFCQCLTSVGMPPMRLWHIEEPG